MPAERIRHAWRRLGPTVLLAAGLLASCQRPAPEQALREAAASLQQAVEQRDAGELADMLAADFIGPDGLDRDGARRLGQGMFLRYRDVGVTLGRLDIAIDGDRATLHCSAVLTGGHDALLPDSGQVYQVSTGWRLEDGDWRLNSIDWTPR